MAATKALSKVDTSKYLAESHIEEVQAIMRSLQDISNTGGLRWTDLPMIKTPAGGSVAWEIPSLDGGDPDVEKTLTGVICHMQTIRRFYEDDAEPDGSPPDCISMNGYDGVGTPGGDCVECPFSKFSTRGRGQACKEYRLVFLLRKEVLFPTIVVIAPTGLKPLGQYIINTAVSGMGDYSRIETQISLTKKSNVDGIEYAFPTFKRVGKLDANAPLNKAVQYYKETIGKALDPKLNTLSAEDMNAITEATDYEVAA